jgi:hypothetical protein
MISPPPPLAFLAAARKFNRQSLFQKRRKTRKEEVVILAVLAGGGGGCSTAEPIKQRRHYAWASTNFSVICIDSPTSKRRTLSIKRELLFQGDSGGPLVVNNGTNRFVLVGATSFGVATCEGPYPSMFARLIFPFLNLSS